MEATPPTAGPIAPPEGEHFWIEDDGEHLRVVVRTEGGAAVWIWFFGFALIFGWQIINTPPGVFTVVMGSIVVLTLIHALNALMGIEIVQIGQNSVLYEQRLVVPIKKRSFPRSGCNRVRVFCNEEMRKPQNDLLHFTLDHGSLRLDTPRGVLSIGASLSREEAHAVCAFLHAKCPDLGEEA